MPFKTFTAGSVFTAADANAYFMNQAVSTFTNEAARDAAITSPSEGMIAYLTTPTVPAATGVTTAVPSGVRTVYNGNVWVCVTDVGASSATDATTTSTSFVTTLTSDGTAISVTLVTGTTAFVHMGYVGNVGTGNSFAMSYSVSGATTVAATDANGAITPSPGGQNFTAHRGQIITGLTAGTNTFTLNYRVTGGTGSFLERWLGVYGIA